ncbi:MAG: hypothetical protein GX167_06365 [Firmicutes bacterium]|nr:hypothetical protein [Bacillota bacterium]
MSPTLAIILFVVFFALMVILSDKLKMSIGLLGALFAFILSGWFGKASPTAVVGYFPTNTIITLFIASTFFCYVQQTGVFGGIVERIMQASKGRTAVIPFALFICSAIVCALGGAEVTPLLLSPIAFAFVNHAGLHPLLAVISTYTGTIGAGLGFWTPGGSTVRALAEAEIGEVPSFITSYQSLFFLFVFSVVIYVCAYYILKGNRLDSAKVSEYLSKKPEPFTGEQKFALKVVAAVVVVTAVPVLFQTLIYPNPVTAWMSTHLALKQNCLLGVLAFHLAKIGDSKEIFKNRIPWSSFVNIAGCVMIVNCAKDLGITDLMANALSTSVPGYFIPAAILVISALLSFVSNMFGIVPLFAPMAAALGEASGLHPATIVACIIAGCNATGISPVSMGGSLHQIGANDEQRAFLFKKQWFTAVVFMLAMAAVSLLGVWKLVDNIFF